MNNIPLIILITGVITIYWVSSWDLTDLIFEQVIKRHMQDTPINRIIFYATISFAMLFLLITLNERDMLVW